jgi:hypothetical protein
MTQQPGESPMDRFHCLQCFHVAFLNAMGKLCIDNFNSPTVPVTHEPKYSDRSSSLNRSRIGSADNFFHPSIDQGAGDDLRLTLALFLRVRR